MFAKMSIVLDPPPRGVFTFEDVVTGRVVFDSTHELSIGLVYVFFHGRIRTKVWQSNNQPQNMNGPAGSETIDVQSLFQQEIKVYSGQSRIPKGSHIEWPFRFDFRGPGVDDPASLPTSGRYYGGHCSVVYKAQAAAGGIGQDEALFKRMYSPDDLLFQKDAPFSLDGLRSKLAAKIGGGAEEELQFLQVRRQAQISNATTGSPDVQLKIPASLLPGMADAVGGEGQERQGHFSLHKEPDIYFQVGLQLPQTVIHGTRFPCWLRVGSQLADWLANPPPVQLTAFKMKLAVEQVARASMAHSADQRTQLIFEDRNVAVPLGPQWTDVGQFFPLAISDPNLVPSFNARLLQMAYHLPVEVHVTIAGRSFKAEFRVPPKSLELVSNIAAAGTPMAPPMGAPPGAYTGAPPAQNEKSAAWAAAPGPSTAAAPMPVPTSTTGTVNKTRLKQAYVGHISGGGTVHRDSVLEAALTLSRVLTAAGVAQEFTGKGTGFKLLAYRPPPGSMLNDKNYDQRQDDAEVMHDLLNTTGLYRMIRNFSFAGLDAHYTDPLHGDDIVVQLPHMHFQNETVAHRLQRELRDHTDEVVELDAVVLFNHRLDTAINRQSLTETEAGDFRSLLGAFERQLHHHRKRIDVNAARIAARKYPVVGEVLQILGVEMPAAPAPAPAPAPATYGPGPSYGAPASQQPVPGLGNSGDAAWAFAHGGPNATVPRQPAAAGAEAGSEGHEGLVKGFKNLFHSRHHRDE